MDVREISLLEAGPSLEPKGDPKDSKEQSNGTVKWESMGF